MRPSVTAPVHAYGGDGPGIGEGRHLAPPSVHAGGRASPSLSRARPVRAPAGAVASLNKQRPAPAWRIMALAGGAGHGCRAGRALRPSLARAQAHGPPRDTGPSATRAAGRRKDTALFKSGCIPAATRAAGRRASAAATVRAGEDRPVPPPGRCPPVRPGRERTGQQWAGGSGPAPQAPGAPATGPPCRACPKLRPGLDKRARALYVLPLYGIHALPVPPDRQ